jgi:hypothetical protein
MASQSPKPPKEPKEPKEPKQKESSQGAQMIKLALMMTGLSVAIKFATAPLKLLTSLPGLAKSLVGGFGSLVKAFSGLDISLTNVSKALSSGLAAADAMNERALGMGKTLGGFQTAFGSQIEKMPGILSQKLSTTMDMFEGGLRGNTAQVAKLAQLQKIAGKDSKAFIGSMSELQTSMGMTNMGLNSVANATIKAQYSYGVNTEKLVGAMNALSQETKDVGLLEGLGSQFAGAVGEITGMLGGKGEKEISALFKVLTGGAEMDAEAARLGIRDQRNRIHAGMSQKELVETVLSAARTGGKTIERMQGHLGGLDAGGIGRRTEVLKNQLGSSVTAIKGFNSMLALEGVSRAKGMKQGLNILGTLKQQALALWEPISNLWLTEGAKLYNQLVANATEIGQAFTAYIVNPIRDIVGGFMGSMLENGNMMDGIKKIFQAVGRVVTWVANTLGKTFGDGGSMYDKVIDFFSGILLNIAKGFDDFVLDALPTIELAFLTVASTILRALGKVMDIDQGTIDSIEGRRQEAKLRMMTDEDVDALVTGISRGKDDFGSNYDVGGAMAGAAVGAAIGSIIPGVGTIVGGVGGLLVGAVGGWFAGDKVEEAIEGSFGKFWITHPITGAEEAFKTHAEAGIRGKQIQDEVRAEVANRRKTMSMTDKLALLQEKSMKKEEKSVSNQLDYLAMIVDQNEEIASNTAPVEEALEITPGTDFQSTMGEILSSSILHVLQTSSAQRDAQLLDIQKSIKEELVKQTEKPDPEQQLVGGK